MALKQCKAYLSNIKQENKQIIIIKNFFSFSFFKLKKKKEEKKESEMFINVQVSDLHPYSLEWSLRLSISGQIKSLAKTSLIRPLRNILFFLFTQIQMNCLARHSSLKPDIKVR